MNNLYDNIINEIEIMIENSENELQSCQDKSNDFWIGYMTGQLNGFLIAKAIMATEFNRLLLKDKE